MHAAAERAASLVSSSQRMRVLLTQHRPELVASMLYPLVLMLSGLNVLSTWTPNLLLALGADQRFALRSNTLMMGVGLLAALPGEGSLTACQCWFAHAESSWVVLCELEAPFAVASRPAGRCRSGPFSSPSLEAVRPPLRLHACSVGECSTQSLHVHCLPDAFTKWSAAPNEPVCSIRVCMCMLGQRWS